jgi:hypothetical protein
MAYTILIPSNIFFARTYRNVPSFLAFFLFCASRFCFAFWPCRAAPMQLRKAPSKIVITLAERLVGSYLNLKYHPVPRVLSLKVKAGKAFEASDPPFGPSFSVVLFLPDLPLHPHVRASPTWRGLRAGRGTMEGVPALVARCAFVFGRFGHLGMFCF